MLLICASAASTVHAAEITTWDDLPNNDIHVIVNGVIKPGDSEVLGETIHHLKHDIATMRRIIVNLRSSGGSFLGGLRIAEIIRSEKLATFVGPNEMCASVCAIIWLAGKERYVTNTSLIGFHSVYENGSEEKSSEGNDILRRYLTEWGFNDDFVKYVTTAGPNEILFLSKETAARYSIALDGKKELPSETFIQLALQRIAREANRGVSRPAASIPANMCASSQVFHTLQDIGRRRWIELYSLTGGELVGSIPEFRYCRALTYSSAGKRWLYYTVSVNLQTGSYWVNVTGYSGPLW
jgi:hypothetical protein